MTDQPPEREGEEPSIVHLQAALGVRERSADPQSAAAEFQSALIGLRVNFHQALCRRFEYPVLSTERLEAIVRQERDETSVLAQAIAVARVDRANARSERNFDEKTSEAAAAPGVGRPVRSQGLMERIWRIFSRSSGLR